MRAFERFKAWCRRANGLDRAQSDSQNGYEKVNGNSRAAVQEHTGNSSKNGSERSEQGRATSVKSNSIGSHADDSASLQVKARHARGGQQRNPPKVSKINTKTKINLLSYPPPLLTC